jgi:hypothetical protein
VGTRTPDLYRVKVPLIGFTTTYKTAGTAKVRGSSYKTYFCGLGCGLEKAGELQNRPTYFPERISIVSWISDIRERIGSVNTSAFVGTNPTDEP